MTTTRSPRPPATYDTDDEQILALRKTYNDLLQKHKEAIKPEAEQVRAAGGLFIIGHRAPRVPPQSTTSSGAVPAARATPARAASTSPSRMTCSASSAANRIQSMMATLKVDEDTPIAAKMLSNTIEGALAKVEGRNFAIRKNVLQFDDVANRQREVIYKQRQQVLDGRGHLRRHLQNDR